jgi:hypothetical protein
MTHDRVGGNQFALTQVLLALMLACDVRVLLSPPESSNARDSFATGTARSLGVHLGRRTERVRRNWPDSSSQDSWLEGSAHPERPGSAR